MAETLASLLARGLDHHRAGRVDLAEASYRQALARSPGDGEAMHLLGLARLGRGDAQEATAWLRKACAARPDDPQAAYNLGTALLAVKQPEEAATAFARALELRPDYAEAEFNLGEACRLAGRLEEALTHLQAVQERLASLPEVPNALGLAHRAQGRATEARRAFRRALELDPGFTEAEVNLGLLDLDAGDLGAALECWEGLLDRLGDHPLLAYNVAVAVLKSDNAPQALALFRRAAAADPDLLEARIGEAQALRQAGDAQGALALYEALAASAPASPEVREGLGLTLLALGREAEAVAALEAGLGIPGLKDDLRARMLSAIGSARRADFQDEAAEARLREALALDPGLPDASLNLGLLLATQGRIPEAHGALLRAFGGGGSVAARLSLAFAIPPILPDLEDIPRERAAQEAYLDLLADEGLVSTDPLQDFLLPTFFTAYRGLCDRDLHARLAQVLEQAHPALTWMAPHCLEPSDWDGQRRLRVGFLSRHFKNHSIGKTSLGLIRETDPARFERVALSILPNDDETSRAIEAAADRFVRLPYNLLDARRLIAEQRLDVLFYQDLGMETLSWLLAFARLAPVQCVSFGHPDTTGIPNVDWWVSSDLFEPEGAQAHYSERLHLLKDAGTLAYYYPPRDPGPVTRADLGLPEEGRLYVCPQTLFKFHPEFDPVLEGILRGDSGGRLVLLRSDITHWRDALLARFRRRFPDLLDRVVFLGRLDEDAFNGLLRLADVVLDTPHFNGMNSSLQAFAMGAPVVTWPQTFQRGRHTRGMYARMGWMDLVAASAEEYVALTLRLGQDRGFRARAVAEIEARRGRLFEDKGVVRQFEDFFEMAVRESQAPLPRDLRVAVVTPYHAEPEAMLRKGHESVLAQTYPATHILVADGRPAPFVEGWKAQHVVLPVASRDNGHTPRTVGALSAIRQGFDAIAYLDADNWLHPRHLEALVRHQRRTGAEVVSSRRTFCRWEDGSPMPIDVDPTHEAVTVDTGCHLFTRAAFRFQPLWSLMPRPFTPVGSRLVWNALVESGVRVAFNGAPTLHFRSQYAFHYLALGEDPPDLAKTGEWDEAAKALHLEQEPELRALLAGHFPGAADVREARWRCPLPLVGLGPTAAEIEAVREPEPDPEPQPPPRPRDLLMVTDLPVDPRKGGSEQRFLAVLRELLADGHRVRHACLAPLHEPPPGLKELEAEGAYTFEGSVFESLHRLAPPEVLWLGHLWNSTSLGAAVHLVATLRRLWARSFPVVFDANDYLYKSQAPLLEAVPRAILQKRFNALVREADAVVYVSGLDRGQALRFAGGERSRAFVASMAVDLQPAALAVPFAARQGLCFFGGDHEGNVDAARRLLELMPALLARRPDLELHLYGLAMVRPRIEVPEDLQDRVRLHGWVPDFSAAVARHRVQALPVRLGAGIKIKVLDSLAHGTPVVGTRRGFEGLGLVAGETALEAEDDAGFVDAVLRLHHDEALWTRLRAAGAAHVGARFNREALRHGLRAVFASLPRGGGRAG
ncbi:MAG: tetratricopeptide repeat protein [Holophagaceae bacterium]